MLKASGEMLLPNEALPRHCTSENKYMGDDYS